MNVMRGIFVLLLVWFVSGSLKCQSEQICFSNEEADFLYKVLEKSDSDDCLILDEFEYFTLNSILARKECEESNSRIKYKKFTAEELLKIKAICDVTENKYSVINSSYSWELDSTLTFDEFYSQFFNNSESFKLDTIEPNLKMSCFTKSFLPKTLSSSKEMLLNNQEWTNFGSEGFIPSSERYVLISNNSLQILDNAEELVTEVNALTNQDETIIIKRLISNQQLSTEKQITDSQDTLETGDAEIVEEKNPTDSISLSNTLTQEQIIEQKDIVLYFGFDKKSPLNIDDLKSVDPELFKSNLCIKVTGYADTIGDSKYNYSLGLKRAKNIKELLQKIYNYNPDNVQVISKGEEPWQGNGSISIAEQRRVAVSFVECNLD